jgi:hypothetical protein
MLVVLFDNTSGCGAEPIALRDALRDEIASLGMGSCISVSVVALLESNRVDVWHQDESVWQREYRALEAMLHETVQQLHVAFPP